MASNFYDFSFPQAGSQTSTAIKEHKRAYMACIPCRRSKAKCELGSDSGGSCTKCQRERRECVFSAKRSTKKRRKGDREASSKEEHSADADPGLENGESGSTDNPTSYHDSSVLPTNGDESQIASRPNQTTSPYRAQSGRHERPGSNEGNSQAETSESPRKRPSVRRRPSTSTMERDVIDTVVSSSKDALGLLFKAAEQQDGSDDSSVIQDNAAPSYPNDSPSSSFLYAPVPVPPSELSKPAQDILDVWDAFRFVRQGWFTAREAVTYIDLFFRNLNYLSPILDSFYSRHENHKSLVYNEPLLCCTLLMISSRYHVLPGPSSRSDFIHMRLWKHCEHLIQRITFGQEKLSTAKSRTMGSIESLLLMTEWHPRALHFPPESEGWDSGLGLNTEDAHGSTKCNDDPNMTRWREEVFEPAKRSDRMSWMLLGLATTLAHELGVFDPPGIEGDAEEPEAVRLSKSRIRRLLSVYVNQLALRLGCTSLLPISNSQTATYPQATSNASSEMESDLQTFISLWIEITKLLKTASEMLFPNKAFTRQLLISERYVSLLEHFQPVLAQWHKSFLEYRNNARSEAREEILQIDYEYCRMYMNSIAVQAFVMRAKTREGTNLEFNYDFLTPENRRDYRFIKEVTDASRQILERAIALAESGSLRFAPVRVFLRVTSASIFLLKAISLGARNGELQKSFDVLGRCIQALRSSTSDDIHLSSRYGTLIERHMNRFLRNFKKQSTQVPGIDIAAPAQKSGVAQPQGVPHDFPMDENALTDRNATNVAPLLERLDANIPLEDWFAQPFDPLIASFGMGMDQSAPGFEFESLDFFWNIPD